MWLVLGAVEGKRARKGWRTTARQAGRTREIRLREAARRYLGVELEKLETEQLPAVLEELAQRSVGLMGADVTRLYPGASRQSVVDDRNGAT